MPADNAAERHHHLQELAEIRELGRPGAVIIAVLAALLAIVTMLADRASVETVLSQGRASDHWNLYQTAVFQQHVDLDVAGMLRAIATGDPQAADALRAEAAKLTARVGTRHAQEQRRTAGLARQEEHERDVAESKHHGYQYAESGLEVAIVLCSVSIIVQRYWLLGTGSGIGLLSALIAADTFFSASGVTF